MAYASGMRIWALLAGLAVVIAGCGFAADSRGSSSTMTATEALHQARADGFTRPARKAGESYRCDPHRIDVGPANPTGDYADYQVPSYGLEFGDRRAPPDKEDTARIAMTVLVFRDANSATRCARAGLYMTQHQPVHSTAFLPGRSTQTFPYRMITPTTAETHMHGPDAVGQLPMTDGYYETWLSYGRVLAFGLAYNAKHALVMRTDLDRIARQIA
jgi:hypothetical protein